MPWRPAPVVGVVCVCSLTMGGDVMRDRLIAADAWRRAAVAAETAQLAFERLAVLERDGAAWLAIATAWRHATWAKNAAMSALEDAANDGGPPEADLRGEVV